MTVLQRISIILLLVHLADAAEQAAISWGTVGVAWALCTVTTVFIVVMALKLQRVLRRKYQKRPAVRREQSARESKRSGASTHTRTTLLSHGTHRNSAHSDHRHTSLKPAHMKRSVSDDAAYHSRRKTMDFTSQWCTERGLNENTANVLRRNGFVDAMTLTSLRVEDVPGLGLISKAEECVLRKVLFETQAVEPLHIDIQDEQSLPSAYRYRKRTISSDNFNTKKSTSDNYLGSRAGPSQASSQTGVSTPLLDRAQSFHDLSENDIIFEDGARMPTSKSYDVIEEGKSRMFGAASAIKLSEAADVPQPSITKATNAKGFNGLLSDKGLYVLASDIGMEWQQLAALLGVSTAMVQQIKLDHVGNTRQQIYEMLRLWRDTASGSKEQIKGALKAQVDILGRRDIGERLLKEQVEGSSERLSFHSIV